MTVNRRAGWLKRAEWWVIDQIWSWPRWIRVACTIVLTITAILVVVTIRKASTGHLW
jgi:hypothetical protein